MMKRANMHYGVAVLVVMLVQFATVHPSRAFDLSDMTGCWQSQQFNATSLLTSADNPNSAELLIEKMLLRFDVIDGTSYLVFGRMYEWDKAGTYVLGPTYQNGAFNPSARFLTLGFPRGGLDHVTLSAANRLVYVHAKSSTKSAMSVRELARIDCGKFDKLEADLLKRQKSLQ